MNTFMGEYQNFFHSYGSNWEQLRNTTNWRKVAFFSVSAASLCAAMWCESINLGSRIHLHTSNEKMRSDVALKNTSSVTLKFHLHDICCSEQLINLVINCNRLT